MNRVNKKFHDEMVRFFETAYRQQVSENVKRGIRAAKERRNKK